MKTQKCPQCDREIDFDKKQSWFQCWKNKRALKYAKKMSGLSKEDIPELKNFYCDCGLHITFVKDKNGEWKWATASYVE